MDLVTESLTLMAGTSSLPCSASWYRRLTPVVVSSETPFQPSTTVFQKPGRSFATRLSRFLITCSSWLPDGLLTKLSSPFSSSKPLWISRVTSPPSSTTISGPRKPPLPSGKLSASRVQSQYSSSVSPFQANTGVPVAAMAAAAWSWVEKMLQDAQRTSAPMSLRVSISTAVWIVMCSEPVTRTPLSGASGAYLRRIDIRPGISCSAISISRRPQSASVMSATL